MTGSFLLLGMLLLLTATSAGHFFVADEMCYFYMAQSFVDHGKFDVPSREVDVNVRQAQVGKDGRYYAPYSFGHSLYLAPWVWVGRAAHSLFGAPWAPVFAFSFAHSVTMSLTWTLFFLVLLDYGLPARRALVFTLISLVSTLAFPYARSLFAEPVLALTLMASWLCLRSRGARALVFSICAGLVLAFAVTVRPGAAVLLPGFWLLAWRQTEGERFRKTRTGVVALISLTGIGWIAFFNYLRFGTILSSGYPLLPSGKAVGFTAPLWFGLTIFLASPGKAIWLFNPLLVISGIGWKRVWTDHRTTALFVAWLFLANLGLHAVWCQPEGGTCWGPRFFVALLPMLLLPAALFWNQNDSTNVRLALGGLATLGFLVQIVGVAVNYSSVILFESMVPKFASKAVYYDAPGSYNLAFSPFPAHIDRLAGILSEGSVLALRPDSVRVASERSTTHSFPFWCDAIDVWAVHLVKDGYSAARVLTIESLLVILAAASLLLAFRTAGRRDLAGADPPPETCSD
jgi:hypothetical protein